MKNKLLVILGSTSTGKTDVAIDLSQKLNSELISADSRQLYKYLDIGTGKLPSNESWVMNQVSRGDGYWSINGINVWMYDVVNPETRFNLYEFILKAQEIINQIVKRGKLPILVGGTGLYIRGLLEGISDFGTDENNDLRSELETMDIEEVRKRIEKVDPQILEKFNNSELNNKRRLIRLLEKLVNPEKSSKSFPGIEKEFDVLKIGLKVDKSILKSRIKQRVISRIDQGMIEESKNLLEKNILSLKRMDELGLEYRYLAKLMTGEIKTVDELVDILSLKISQFAKRQETWFKKEKNVDWFDISNKEYLEKIESRVLSWYNSKQGAKSTTSTTGTTGFKEKSS